MYVKIPIGKRDRIWISFFRRPLVLLISWGLYHGNVNGNETYSVVRQWRLIG